jgi:hypothetical protein
MIDEVLHRYRKQGRRQRAIERMLSKQSLRESMSQALDELASPRDDDQGEVVLLPPPAAAAYNTV